MTFDINSINGHEPLINYPWRTEIDILLSWLKEQDSSRRGFCFDLIMSATYLDATSGLEKNIEACSNTPADYNAHLGFINLCSPCYSICGKWSYQKAAKPQSGVLGKLSSEVILRFIEKLYPELIEVIAVGGTEVADAVLKHSSGMIILAEVKSAPLLTYPFVFKVKDSCLNGEHEKLTITSSQLRDCHSALYLHNHQYIDLGKIGDHLWPFKPLVNFLVNPSNTSFINTSTALWLEAKNAYSQKDRSNKTYYLANASGNPPKVASEKNSWPKSASISDSKTSAGMDRTDDIKKGIYQSLKIGTQLKSNPELKTALISNLPAYRHGKEYVVPFINMYWGLEEDIKNIEGTQAIMLENLRRVFDFIITLEEPILRDINL
jgi:hypothetical protein